MADVQFSGVASGLDTAGIIKALLDVQRQALDAVAAVVGHRPPQFPFAHLLLALLVADPLNLAPVARHFIGKVQQPRVEQRRLQPGKIAQQRFASGP